MISILKAAKRFIKKGNMFNISLDSPLKAVSIINCNAEEIKTRRGLKTSCKIVNSFEREISQ